jgi:hypothetical protein
MACREAARPHHLALSAAVSLVERVIGIKQLTCGNVLELQESPSSPTAKKQPVRQLR